MRRWLARFGFSAIVLAFVLFWTAYLRQKLEGATTRVVLTTVGGGLLAAIGLAGVRERHRGTIDGRIRNEVGPVASDRPLHNREN